VQASSGNVIGPGQAGLLVNASVTGRGDDVLFSEHFYDSDAAGAPTLKLQRMTYDGEGWPQLSRWTGP
jgi:hypothetical protein